MPRHTRLTRRSSGTYYLRVSVPADLRESLGKREIWRSLGTRNRPEAERLVRIASVKVDEEFEQERRRLAGESDSLSQSEISHLKQLWLRHLLEEDESERILGLGDRGLEKAQETIDIVGPATEQDLARGDLSDWEAEFEDFIRSHGHAVQAGSDQFRRLGYELLKTTVEAYRLIQARQQGEPVDTPPPPSAQPSQHPDGYTIGQLVHDYMADPQKARSESTIKTYRTAFRALEELLGADTPAASVHRRHCEQIRDTIRRLPRNAAQRFPGVSLEEVARIADAQGLPRIKPATVNSYLTNLASLFKWGQKNWRVERNPAEGLQVHNPVADKDQRRSFKPEELTTIFSAPLYTGCQNDEEGYAKPGPNRPRRGRFWVPLLSLWTGMRLGECCQLHVEDVAEIDGVQCILIRETPEPGGDAGDLKRVKTSAGRRFVPVHPELERIGFHSFVAAQVAAGERRLFPEIAADSQGYVSGTFSKWFNDKRRFLGKLGLAGNSVSFHSFRHCYRDALREAKIGLERVRLLGGWKRESSGEEARYGDGPSAKSLREDIGKISYKGLDLSHLYKF